MAKVLYIHGFFAGPNGKKATALRQHGHDVRDPAIDYRQPFGRAVEQLQREYDEWHPDVIVGTSLGGGIAMSLDSNSTPMVLIAPMWDLARLSVPVDMLTRKAGYPLALVAAAIGATGKSLATALSCFWNVRVPPRVKAETIILHAADDSLIECRHSRSLLAKSPQLPADSPVHDVLGELSDAGYRTQGVNHRDDPRLVIIGQGHHCKSASENCPANPGRSPIDCLVLASSGLAAVGRADQVLAASGAPPVASSSWSSVIRP